MRLRYLCGMVYTIILERISDGYRAPSLVTRQPDEAAARTYAEAMIAGRDDLRVAEIVARGKGGR